MKSGGFNMDSRYKHCLVPGGKPAMA